MKSVYDSAHRDVQFQVGDLVLVKLQPYRQKSLRQTTNQKLSPKYYGPFPMLDRIGSVAYKLDLPQEAKIHPVFHISCLKKFHGSNIGEEPPVLPVAQPTEAHPKP
ncbi:hypothetical protein QQ045_018673 [Rhodiola kirilowii]